ncbi:MAG: caspase family protein [Bradyrhizobium sp.]
MRHSLFRDLLLPSAFFVLVQACGASAAFAENRVALVIGQSAYRAVPALPNAANDGKRMTELLGNAGFEVTAAPDLAQNDMRKAVSDFAAKVAASGPDTVALVFYAGHGLQIDGENYLVPVDVDPKREADIPLQAVRLNDLMNTLGALPTRMRVLMLDACRNNPFPALNKTAGQGLAIVDTKSGASGWFISFSTSPGAEAEDGDGDNSPYTTAVLSVVKEPNLPIEEAFKRVRVSVNQATDGRQVPWESSSLTADFRFFGDKDPGQSMAGPKPVAARSMDDWRKDLAGKEPRAAYDLVIADDSVAAYEAFTVLYAQSPYTPRMRSLLERRREMLAWQTAVTTNTASSFDTFLASYGSSDLAATAHKMQERVRNRSLGASAALMSPTNVALGPTCPCSITPATPPVFKKVEPAPPRTRHVDKTTPKRTWGRAQVYYEEEESSPFSNYSSPLGVGGYVGGFGGGGGYGGGGRGGGNGGRR